MEGRLGKGSEDDGWPPLRVGEKQMKPRQRTYFLCTREENAVIPRKQRVKWLKAIGGWGGAPENLHFEHPVVVVVNVDGFKVSWDALFIGFYFCPDDVFG